MSGVSRFRTGSAAIVGLLLVAPPCRAQSTLREVLAQAIAHNPDLRQARLRVDSAQAERRIARAVPNPTLSAISNAPYQYNATVPLDVGADRIFRTRAASAGARATRLDLDDTERLVRLAVRRGFYDLLLAETLLRTTAEQRDIFRQLLTADSARVQAGDAPSRNLVKSELELARADLELTRARSDVRSARIALQLLMGVDRPDTGFTIKGDLAYRDLGTVLPERPDLAERPDLKAAAARVAEARSVRSLTTASLFPAPAMTLTYQPDGGFAPKDFWTLGAAGRFSLGVELQLPLFNWNGGQRARAATQVEAAAVGETHARQMAEADIALAREQFQAASGLAARYQTGLLERARTALDQARYAYQSGATSLLDVLEAIRSWGDTQAAAAQAFHDYWTSIAALSAALGKDLIADE